MIYLSLVVVVVHAPLAELAHHVVLVPVTFDAVGQVLDDLVLPLDRLLERGDEFLEAVDVSQQLLLLAVVPVYDHVTPQAYQTIARGTTAYKNHVH